MKKKDSSEKKNQFVYSYLHSLTTARFAHCLDYVNLDRQENGASVHRSAVLESAWPLFVLVSVYAFIFVRCLF